MTHTNQHIILKKFKEGCIVGSFVEFNISLHQQPHTCTIHQISSSELPPDNTSFPFFLIKF